MTREFVEWRLVDYLSRLRGDRRRVRARRDLEQARSDHQAAVAHGAPDLPSGETDVRLPDGAAWRFRFMKEFCNVARPLGTATNQLPDLLRRWFGPNAGRPGTGFRVRFTRSPDGWWVEPASARVVTLAPRGSVVTFPSLRAAAGHALAGGRADRVADAPSADTVQLPLSRPPSPDLFAVRAVGDSMDGGDAPIRDGTGSSCAGRARGSHRCRRSPGWRRLAGLGCQGFRVRAEARRARRRPLAARVRQPERSDDPRERGHDGDRDHRTGSGGGGGGYPYRGARRGR